MATDLKREGYSDVATSLKGIFLLICWIISFLSQVNMDQLLTMIKLDLVEDIESATGILSYGSLQRGEVFMMTSDVGAMGFQQKNNNWYTGARLSLRTDQPRGVFLNQELNFRQWISGRHNGFITRNNFEIENDNQICNFWRFGFQIN